MAAPKILAKLIDDTLVMNDEFAWGKVGWFNLAWRILQVEEGVVTAVAVSTVAERPFSQNGEAWAESDLRAWLNDGFMAEYLPEDAKDFLLPGTDEGDLAFVLSQAETESLFGADATRVAEGENRNWWLRDAGGAEGYQAYVHNNGWINEFGAEANSGYAAVRPAIKLRLSAADLALPNDADVIDEPQKVVPAADYVSQHDLMLASEYGEELMLEALDADDVFLLEDFVSWFGVHESWETMMVDTLDALSAEGDSLQVNRLIEMCGGIEFMGDALAEAMNAGHTAVAGTLLRAGAKLDGGLKKVRLIGDTPELRRARKSGYSAETELCDSIVNCDEGCYSVTSLVRQGLIHGRNYNALVRAAGRNEAARDLFQWLLCPDDEPLKHMCAYLSKKRVVVSAQHQPGAVPVSKMGIQLLWYPKMIQENPDTVHAIAPYLTDSSMDGKRELICFLAQTIPYTELQSILSGKRVYSPKDIAAAADAAESVGKTRIADHLREFLRTIGAGKLVQ